MSDVNSETEVGTWNGDTTKFAEIPQHIYWMRRALALAQEALVANEVPVGALVVRKGAVVGEGFNRTISVCDPSAHAEIIALRNASAKLKNHRITDATLYVTLEPCAMCAGAIVQARISSVVFGTPDPKSGAGGSVMNVLQNEHLNHRCEVTGGVLQNECAAILRKFFQSKRI